MPRLTLRSHTGIVVNITDDEEKGLIPVKHMLALYIGGMGAKDRNFHKELISRFGFEAEAVIQDLYLAGKKDEAAMAVPDQLADEISLVGSVDKIRDRLQAWGRNAGHIINVSARSPAELETLANCTRPLTQIAISLGGRLACYGRWCRLVATAIAF